MRMAQFGTIIQTHAFRRIATSLRAPAPFPQAPLPTPTDGQPSYTIRTHPPPPLCVGAGWCLSPLTEQLTTQHLEDIMATRKNNNTNTATNINASPDVESTRALRVEGNTVFADITVRKERGSEPINLKAEISFEGVSQTQLLIWAARTKIIDLQRALRLCDTDFIKDIAKRGPIRRNATEAGTGFADPAKQQQRILSAVQNMSDEEKAALLQLLKAQI